MNVQVAVGDIAQAQADAIIVNLFEGVEPGGATAAVDRALGGMILQLIRDGEITGKKNEVRILHTFGRIPAARVAVVGLGKREKFELDTVRQAMGAAIKAIRGTNAASTVATILHGAGAGGLSANDSARACTVGALLGLYRYTQHKAEETPPKTIEQLTFYVSQGSRDTANDGVRVGTILAESTAFVRDLVNEPASLMTPTLLAERARAMAQEVGLQFEALGPAEMERLGMGALLGVARGSAEEPRLIVLRYSGAEGSAHAPLGIVGKGITFDTGGISIKPAEGMEWMRMDMAGGAAAIGAMRAIALLRPRIDVVAIVPATENMPGGRAQKPGDVVRAMNGKTIEVINTDAEGRLILADALAYAASLGCSPIIDLATLTGACVIALGKVRSGAMTNNHELLERFRAVADAEGEKIWELPMDDEYDALVESDFADVRNTGNVGRQAGTIVGAKLLEKFIGETPWLHLDIAGTAYREDGGSAYQQKGATGVMTRALAMFAFSEASRISG